MVILCNNCGKRDTCPRAKEGHFCLGWEPQDKKPRPGQDPNEQWRRGEDVDVF